MLRIHRYSFVCTCVYSFLPDSLWDRLRPRIPQAWRQMEKICGSFSNRLLSMRPIKSTNIESGTLYGLIVQFDQSPDVFLRCLQVSLNGAVLGLVFCTACLPPLNTRFSTQPYYVFTRHKSGHLAADYGAWFAWASLPKLITISAPQHQKGISKPSAVSPLHVFDLSIT